MKLLEQLEEARIAVDSLNDLCYDKNPNFVEEMGNPFELVYDTITVVIQFKEIPLWCSGEEDRKYNDETKSYEDLEEFCYNKLKKLVINLNLLCL